MGTRKVLLTLSISIIVMMTFVFCGQTSVQNKNQMVRLAKLVIDSAQLENYNALLKEEIEASVRLEPGVLTLYAVAEKNILDAIVVEIGRQWAPGPISSSNAGHQTQVAEFFPFSRIYLQAVPGILVVIAETHFIIVNLQGFIADGRFQYVFGSGEHVGGNDIGPSVVV